MKTGKVGELQITWKPLDPWEYNGEGIGYEVRWRDAGDFEEDWDDVSHIGHAWGHCIMICLNSMIG